MNSERNLQQRAWYYMRIYADTKDPETVYALNTGFYRSTNGGRTFRSIQVPHGDNHDLWIAPNDAQRMINANDGGANVSTQAAPGPSRTRRQPSSTTSRRQRTSLIACAAHSRTIRLAVRARAGGGIDIGDWYVVGGGESGYIAVRPDNPDIVYAGSYGGYL